MQNAQSLELQKKEKVRGCGVGQFLPCVSFAGRVDSVVIDNDVTNYNLSSLFPATEYEISINAVRGSQESRVVSTSVFTGGS